MSGSGGTTTRESESRHPLGGFPAYRLRSWEAVFPGVVCGVTEAAPGSDFALAADDGPAVAERMERLALQFGFSSSAWARQVHGTEVRPADADPAGSFERGEADGLVSRRAGPLLVVTVADCVPVYVLDPGHEALALLHAGWRGTAAGILARGVEALAETYGSSASALHLHLGPAICGGCYEVGGEVLRAVAPGSAAGDGPVRLDLRSQLVEQALALGVSASRISRSSWCTRCDGDRFHSHRGSGGSAGRMAAFLGWRGVA